jgi:hypothetical protein
MDIWLLFALDTDGFVIPSLEIGDPDQGRLDASEVEASKPPSPKVSCKHPELLTEERLQKKVSLNDKTRSNATLYIYLSHQFYIG